MLSPLLLAPGALAADLLLDHARLWDGTGAGVREVSILVSGGHIAAFDPDPRPDVEVVDLAGATVLPGFIDTHVHLVSNPGSHWREDDDEQRQAQVQQALRAYLACGVTTVLDAGTYPPWAAEVRGWLAAGEPGPEIFDLGVALSPPGGYLDRAFPGYPSERDADELRAQMDASDALGAVGYKVVVEPGYGAMRWPIFDDDLARVIADEAEARGKGVFVHAGTVWAVDRALLMRPSVMVHVPDPLRRDQLDALEARGVAFSSTLLTTEHVLDARHQAWMADPLLKRVIPGAQQRTALAPDIGDRMREAVAELVFPRSRALQRIARGVLKSPRAAARALAKKASSIVDIRERGLLIAMGSDAGNWPLFPFMFHGPSSLAEIEALGEAGLTPADALAVSTREGARFLGVEDRLGTVEIGKEADLVVFRDSPLDDLHNVYSVVWTMSDGVLRSPDGWMGEQADTGSQAAF